MGDGADRRGEDEHNVIDQTADNTEGKRDSRVAYWCNEINAARKREKDYREQGRKANQIYAGCKREETPFNILFSNTQTLLPALYSATPRPVVQRRFKDEDPLGKSAATAGARMLEYLVDTNVDGYETFDEAMRNTTLDGLIPGRGSLTVKYDFDEGQMAPAPGAETPTPYVKSELVCVDKKGWDRVYYGYAKKWSKVPWIAYEEFIDLKEAKELFGDVIAAKIKFTTEQRDPDDEESEKDPEERNLGEHKTALVYQIWDKRGGRKIRWVSPQYNDGYLKEEDDPLELTGFFNCPRPLQFIEKVDDLLPVAPYELYKNQARELNRITTRLNKVIEAIKARGVYDSELGDDLKNLLQSDDNAFVPADKSSSLAAEKGLQNAIWFMPLDVLVGVAEKLVMAREQCKRVIYEITGISDIIRGSTAASETATAQKLKSDWGTLRLKNNQKEVQRYARDTLRLMLEVAATKFSEETWAKMTGLPFVTTTQRQQFEMVMAQMQAAGQQMAAVGQQPNAAQQQQFAAVQAELQKPVWGKVLELLRDDMQRSYRIDIETNSTVEPEAVEDQKNIAEVMTALGQFLNGITPLVTSGAMPFQAAQSMMLAIVRRFRFGPEIEDYVKAMQPPKPPDDGKEKAAAEQAAKFAQEKTAGVAEIERLKTELEAEKAGRELDRRAAELALREAKVQVAEDRLKMAEQVALERVDTKDKVSTLKQSANDKVRSIQDAAAKREAQQAQGSASKADATLDTGVKQMTQIVAELTQSLAQQQEQQREVVERLVAAVTAPRRTKAIRGEDGRLSESVSEILN